MAVTYTKIDPPSSNQIFFLVEHMKHVVNRDALLQFFTPCTRHILTDVPDDLVGADAIRISGKPQELDWLDDILTVYLSTQFKDADPNDKLFADASYKVYGIIKVPGESGAYVLLKLQDDGSKAIYSMYDQFELKEGMIASYKGEPTITDVGKFFMNQLVLVNAVGDLIPYINDRIDPGKTDDLIADLLVKGKIGREQYNIYMNYGTWYGEDCSIAVPGWSEKSTGTDPAIAKRKAELFKKLRESPDIKPDEIVAMEQELVEMDKKWLEGDVSMPFWKAGGGKTFNEERKKNYICWGLTTQFGDQNKFVFVEESLTQGWNNETVQVAANDIRKGSYSRAVETAKGGEQTKFVLRTFQNISIVEEDCGTKHGLEILVTQNNYKEYANRYLLDGSIATVEYMKKHIGEKVTIRSPLYCKTSGNNYCSKCCGPIFKETDNDKIGLQALAISGGYSQLALRAMHVGTVTPIKLNNFAAYLR